MIYTITYRDKAGSRAYLELDVPTKGDVWPELKKRGINAISVTEGHAPQAKGAVNKGSKITTKTILLVAALISAIVASLFLLIEKPKQESAESEKDAPTVPTASSVSKVKLAKVTKPKASKSSDLMMPKPSGKRIEKREAIPAPPPLEELQSAMTNSVAKKKKPAFSNAAEQLIALATPSEPGGYVPPLPEITDEGIAEELSKAMGNVIKAEDGDSEKTLEKKITVAEAKEEFKELNATEGFTFTEYLNALRDKANENAEFLGEAHKVSSELYHDQSVSDEDYLEYREAINEKLRERGLPEIE